MLIGKSSKTWCAKLEEEIQPKVVDVPDRWAKRIGHGSMLVPTPLLIDGVVKKIAPGKLATVNTIRDYLAEISRADMTCPLTTGIFLNIVANAAEEKRANGENDISPWWRVLKAGGRLNPKFPGGVLNQAKYLEREGFEIVNGKSVNDLLVKDYKRKLEPFN
jgi:hypothetical protein